MNKLTLFLASIVFLTLPLNAQNHIVFNHLSVEQGLSQSSVTCIFQDRTGFIWLGTQDGLNRYDGYTFKVFKNKATDSASLSDNFIFAMYEDETGTLYIETQSGNFNRYDPLTESFKLITKESVKLDNARSSSLAAALTEKSSIKWSGGLSKPLGLTKTNLKTGKTTVYKHNPSDPSSISDDKVYSVYRDRSGILWVGTVNGLDRMDEISGKFIHYRNNPGDPNSIPDNWVWPIYEDTRGNLWIGTVKKGLTKFSRETGKFINYRNNPGDPSTISDNFIFSIYEDRGGVIWVGTNTGGVNYFSPSAQVFEHYYHDPAVPGSIGDNNILVLHVDRKGNYWVGSRNGGLDKINPDNGSLKNFSEKPPYKLVSNAVQVICEDKQGNLWLGTFNSGLMEFDPVKETYKLYKNDPANPNSLSDNRIYDIIEGSDGFIWIGTYDGGVNKLDPNTGKFTRYLHDPKDPKSLAANNAWSLAEDKDGNLWVGTFGSGLSFLDKTKNEFRHYANVPGNTSSIADNTTIRVFRDSKNNMWIGTSAGFSRYDSKTGSFKNYNQDNGLSNNFVLGIVEDSKGNLWLSTNVGLSKFNPSTETFRNYYYQDGLQGNEFNQNAFARDYIRGNLLFGGPDGFNVFNPDSLKQNSFKPPLAFTDYIRYNTDDEEGRPIIEKGIDARDSILLTYKDNIITLKFAALSFYNNFDNQYKYKLEGFNKNWIQLGSNRTITFTNLSPKEYTLRIIGSNNDGLWNEKGSSLFIEVTPPWWRTNIAYVAYGLIFIGILMGARKIELDRKEQKAKIREGELQMKATIAEKRVIEAENERKTKELEEARQLQLSMLPKEVPQLPDLEIAAFMRTATEVGGDYYDFIVRNGTLNVAFGDATGHGLQAGTMVTLMKGFFTSDAARLELQEFMNHCSNMIKEIKLGRILMSFSFLRIQDRKLSITSAGMPPLYYYNAQTGETEEILIQGIPLGAMRKFNYRVVDKELRSGDSLLLLTDGLPEQMNRQEQMFDYTQVKSSFANLAIHPPKEIIESLVKCGDDWMDGAIQADDMTFVVIKVK